MKRAASSVLPSVRACRRFFQVPANFQPTPKDFGVFKVYLDSDLIAWLVMDRPGKSENSIGSDFQDSIVKAADYISVQHQLGKCKVVVLASAKKRFCVGADVTEVYPVTDKEALHKILASGKEAMKKFNKIGIPSVAAINGDALGGGLELALACDYRVAAASDKHKLGLPEVMLGVIPGLGGTVRLPKLIGLQNALTHILQGKQIKPEKAKKMGLVDALVEDVDRYEGEQRFLKGVRCFAAKVWGKKKKEKKQGWQDWFLSKTPVGRYIVTNQTLKTLDKQTRGNYPAVYKAFESVMNATVEKNFDKANKFESDAFADMCVTGQSKSLMSLFFLQDGCKKLGNQSVHFKESDAVPTKKIAVLGAGVMGSGVAHWAAKNKVACVLKDITDSALQNGLKFVKSEFEKEGKKKKWDKKTLEKTVGLVQGTVSNDGLKGCTVIIEAAVEVMDIKKKMVKELEAAGVLTKDVIFATNTSALSIDELAEVSAFPENVVGMHFFNPVGKMPLVEVIKGKKTSPKALATVYKLALDMGKFPVVVKDGPGFLVNRILGLYMSEAGRMLEEGADLKKVDKLILDFGMPMGPYRLLDEVGIDVAAHVGPTLKNGLGDRFASNPKLEVMIKAGLLGKKTSKGFYNYNEKGKETEINSEVINSLNIVSSGSKPFQYEDVIDRCILSMVNEAALILDEGICFSPEDVDLGMVFGTGFAPFRGGLLNYADNRGISKVVDALNTLSGKYGDRFKPAARLIKMAREGKRFFPNRPLAPIVEKPKVKVRYY